MLTGEVVVGASRRGGQPGVAGRGRLALVTFRALAPGSTSVAFAAQRAMGADLLPLSSVQTRPASVEVRPAEGSLRVDD